MSTAGFQPAAFVIWSFCLSPPPHPQGGFARCYEMTDLSNNKMYAVKVIPQSRVSKPQQRDKVRREFNMWMVLEGRNMYTNKQSGPF